MTARAAQTPWSRTLLMCLCCMAAPSCQADLQRGHISSKCGFALPAADRMQECAAPDSLLGHAACSPSTARQQQAMWQLWLALCCIQVICRADGGCRECQDMTKGTPHPRLLGRRI